MNENNNEIKFCSKEKRCFFKCENYEKKENYKFFNLYEYREKKIIDKNNDNYLKNLIKY
jgi:hypothetical protein